MNFHPEKRPFEFTGRVRSFQYAWRGLRLMLRSQHNAWIHAVATGAVTGFGFVCSLTRFEWCWIILAIAAVWTAEALNTAFELLADVTNREFHPLVEQAKDVAAGAVLIAAFVAVLIGTLVFHPHLRALLGSI